MPSIRLKRGSDDRCSLEVEVLDLELGEECLECIESAFIE
jgi:hypothetical protein